MRSILRHAFLLLALVAGSSLLLFSRVDHGSNHFQSPTKSTIGRPLDRAKAEQNQPRRLRMKMFPFDFSATNFFSNRTMPKISFFSNGRGQRRKQRGGGTPRHPPRTPTRREPPTNSPALSSNKEKEKGVGEKKDDSVTWACPDLDGEGENPISMEHAMTTDGTTSFTALLLPKSPVGVLCQLSVETPNIETRFLARSYDGYDWEKYSNFDGMAATNRHRHNHVEEIKCNKDDDTCLVTIAFVPAPTTTSMAHSKNSTVSLPTASTLFLRTSSPVALSQDAEMARFLEQATFGTRRQDVQLLRQNQTDHQLASPQMAMAAWVAHQQDSVAPTLLRQAYRQRLNVRYPASSRIASVGHPCHRGAWYRRATFSERDNGQVAEFVRHEVSIDTAGSDSAANYSIAISVNGVVRTHVAGPILKRRKEILLGSYKVCSYPVPVVGGSFRLTFPGGKCDAVGFGEESGNPPIQFADIGTTSTSQQTPRLNLDGFVRSEENSSGTDSNELPEFLYVDTALEDDACTSNFSSWASTVGEFPVVFGIYNGHGYIHEPRFHLRENGVDNPLSDGGGHLHFQTTSAALEKGESYDPSVDFPVACANVDMTFVNQEACVLRAELNTCEASSFSTVLSLSDETTVGGTVVCGSPGEVASNNASISNGGLSILAERYRAMFGSVRDARRYQRKLVWTETVVWSEDQLRQRVAWALSQIFAITPYSLGTDRTERFLHFYDIFVRHAFGNFRDVLREVAYSPVMATMLSFQKSRSTAQERRRSGAVVSPDENFAREVMQLFMLGLYELNEDGSVKRDVNGPILTYTNNEIMEYARVWTGFDRRVARGNIEDAGGRDNQIDPMQIDPQDRDMFPKMGLQGKYIGEGFPLCSDLPHGHFLKKGAEYRLLGGYSRPRLQTEPETWVNNADRTVLHLQISSEPDNLFAKLCVPDSRNSCTYPATITLDGNVECRGTECLYGSVNIVKLETGVFYEYVRPPCVYQAFYANARKIEQSQKSKRKYHSCANPLTEVASAACCADGKESGSPMDLFWGEKLPFESASERCDESGDGKLHTHLCTRSKIKLSNCNGNQCDHEPFYWTGFTDCRLQAKVNQEGKVAIVYDVESEKESRLVPHLRSNTQNFFQVEWSSKKEVHEIYKSCEIHDWCVRSDGDCICHVSLEEEAVFDDMPTPEEVLGLSIGAFDPVVMPLNFSERKHGGVTAHADVERYGWYSKETIFEVTDDRGQRHLRKNIRSIVSLLGLSVSFRNPVHFLTLTDGNWDERDAMQETEAALDHYFYHPNVAPFLAIRLAQRFGISNPTPRYVSTIVRAFKSGTYKFSEGSQAISFGKGSYGDLASTVAAVLLDREARALTLDADVIHGSLREPLLKVIGLMRSMDFAPKADYPLPYFSSLENRIGQMVFEQPDVFSFFDPGFQPEGEIAQLGLVSPESQLYVAPFIVGTMNGLVSMIKYGLNSCFGGFGDTPLGKCSQEKGENDGSYGNLAFLPASRNPADVVDELAALLTSGRLSQRNRKLIAEAYSLEQDQSLALILAEQMIVSTPEFHASGAVEGIEGKILEPPPQPEPSKKPYKAVVHIMLSGGYDSFNLIVPHEDCTDTMAEGSLHDQYIKYRGKLAISADKRSQLVEVDGQPCKSFAINEDIPIVHDLFSSGKLTFFLNTGGLDNPSNKSDYGSSSITQLFAHNTMQHESARVDPRDESPRSGVLGRLASVLSESYSFVTGLFSLNEYSLAVQGGPKGSTIVQETGPVPLLNRGVGEFDLKQFIGRMNNINQQTSSLHGKLWSQRFIDAATETEMLVSALESTKSKTKGADSSTSARKLSMVSQWIQTRETRGVDRDLIYLTVEGWDHHARAPEHLEEGHVNLNKGLKYFVNELKALDLWDNVTVVVTSEFGRTLTPNSNKGTDHGWAGHYFIFGGSVKGKQILGKYPDDLGPSGPLNVGRGRFIPTLSWESLWNPILEWMGVAGGDQDRDIILPNALRTNTTLFRQEEVFE